MEQMLSLPQFIVSRLEVWTDPVFWEGEQIETRMLIGTPTHTTWGSDSQRGVGGRGSGIGGLGGVQGGDLQTILTAKLPFSYKRTRA